jgi:cytochrome c biogenesis protein
MPIAAPLDLSTQALETPGRTARLFAALASLKLTLAALVLLAVGVALAYNRQGEGEATWPLVLPLSLLAGNLAAAVATNRAFRRQAPLLVFHLALLAIIVLITLGRLTYLRGTAEVVTGGEFDGLLTRDAGPWHSGRIDDLRFASEGFAIHYSPGLQRDATVNRVVWRDAAGLPHRLEIGDQVPLVIGGYRFYTTSNKGFAPVFVWLPDDGQPVRGAVHLPGYPLHRYEQAQQWQLPGTTSSLWIMLAFDEVLLDPAKAGEFRLPEAHRIVVRSDGERTELAPGGRLRLPGGTLIYQGLTSWMGYAVFYDWTMPWLLAACTLAVVALAWHFRDKYFARPWHGGA